MSQEGAKKSSVFYDGRPIDGFDQDRLDRKHFARSFMDAILSHDGKESLVLAVNAPWGEGKTSFKNMMVSLMEQEHSDKVITLHFSPWEWASQNQVASAFFTEIAKQIKLKDESKEAVDAASNLNALGRFLGFSKIAVPAFAPFLEMVLPGASLVGIAAGKGIEQAQKLAEETAKDIQEAAQDASKSLQEIKKCLRKALEDYNKKKGKLLLVIVDDIDRLQPDEILLILQMVRANGDFPALIFLLLYDEKFVVKALGKAFPESAQKFLEKIVQFQINLPVLAEDQVKRVVLDGVSVILSSKKGYQALFETARFNELWDGGIKEYIKNLRSAERLLSSYRFHIGVFRSEEVEVNPVDLLALEVLRLNESEVYLKIKDSSEKLMPQFNWTKYLPSQKDKESDLRLALKEIAKLASVENRQAASFVINHLFPEDSSGVTPYGPTAKTSEASEMRRVCHVMYFYRYFRLTIDEDDLPDSRVTELQKTMDFPIKFVEALRQLHKESKLTLALTKLLSRNSLKESKNPQAFIAAVCGFGDEVGLFNQPTHHIQFVPSLIQLIHLQVPKELTDGERLGRFIGALASSDSVHIFSKIAEAEDSAQHHYETASGSERQGMRHHLSKDAVKKFNDAVACRIVELVSKGKIGISEYWQETINWYVSFQSKHLRKNSDLLFRNKWFLKHFVHSLIGQNLIEMSDRGVPFHFARIPLFHVKTVCGFRKFEKSLKSIENEATDQPILLRKIAIYRDLKGKFSGALAGGKKVKKSNDAEPEGPIGEAVQIPPHPTDKA